MSDKTDRKIGEEIRRITGTGQGERFPVMSGVVTDVDTDNNECTVQLTTDSEDTPTDGVLLNVSTANMNGFYLVPEINADCIVAEIDGPGKWELLRASSYSSASLMMTGSSSTKLTITDGLIQFNDGSLGGLTKTLELQTQINKLNTLVSHLVTIINGAPVDEPGSGSPSALQVALKAAIAADSVGDFSAIENTNIKQG